MLNLFAAVLLSFLLPFGALKANEICGRVAKINFQDVLVDTTSNQKGEGLRFYLSKDEVAEEYLNKYQSGQRLRWPLAVAGTVGSSMALYGLLQRSDTGNSKNKGRTFIIAGVSALLVNYLISLTLNSANESNLTKAIDEYNKRNLPKIEFEGL